MVQKGCSVLPIDQVINYYPHLDTRTTSQGADTPLALRVCPTITQTIPGPHLRLRWTLKVFAGYRHLNTLQNWRLLQLLCGLCQQLISSLLYKGLQGFKFACACKDIIAGIAHESQLQ